MLQPQDQIEKIIGGFESYQQCIVMFVSVMNFFVAYHQLGIIYIAPKIKYTCGNNTQTDTAVCPCKNPIYDHTRFRESIVDHWNMICRRKLLISLTQALIQAGVFVGRIGFSFSLQRFGPKNILIICVILQKILSSSIPFVKSLPLFLSLRFLLGSFIGGALVSGFAFITEFVGREYMDIAFVLYQIPYILGYILLTMFGYCLRNYRAFLFYTTLSEIVLGLYWFLPPTPRWLISRRKLSTAAEVLTAITITNSLSAEHIQQTVNNYTLQKQSMSQTKQNYKLMLYNPGIRKCIFMMSLMWFSSSYCFYGLAQYISQIEGNIFRNVSIAATACLPGTLLALILLRKISRKVVCVILNLITISCLAAMAFMPDLTVALVASILVVVSNFMLRIILFVYCYEMFPMILTTEALQFTWAMAGLGAITAPFVISARILEKWLMPVIFFIPPSLACAISFVLPETKGLKPLKTIEEAERFIRHPNFRNEASALAVYTATIKYLKNVPRSKQASVSLKRK